MIKVHYWESDNFGEQLVAPIMKYLFGKSIEWVSKDTTNKYLIIGSEFPTAVREGDVIWGYGSRFDERIILPSNVKVLALRGRRTHSLIDSDFSFDGVYGDPALIMPQLYTPSTTQKKYKVGIIAHWRNREQFRRLASSDILVIDIYEDWHKIIDNINICETIVASSLHGTIVSEAYGVPVSWFLGENPSLEKYEFKFLDYFSSTGRDYPIIPQKFNKYTSEEVFNIAQNILPSPIIDVTQLIKVGKEHFQGV